MKKPIAIGISSLLLIGCLGKTPVLVETHQPTDNLLQCEGLAEEIGNVETTIKQKTKHRNQKIGSNAVLFTMGVLLFPPTLLLMDSKTDEKAEIEALMNRRASLRTLYNHNQCDEKTGPILSNAQLTPGVKPNSVNTTDGK